MKNLIIFCLGLTLMTSCVDLDMTPVDAYSSDTFFGNKQATFNYLASCYAAANMSGQFTGSATGDNYMFDAITDNGVSWPPNGLPSYVALGTAVATQGGYYNLWQATWPYVGIRNDNFFLENVDKTPGLDEATATQWKAEVRFIRAFDYARKYMCYGGVPLVTKVLAYGEELEYPRVPGDDIYNFVISELNDVIPLLPADNQGRSDASRATRGAALALKVRLELFHGSMKMSGLADGVTEPTGVVDNQAAIVAFKAAVQDAEALINLGEYGIANDYEGLYLESAQGGSDRQKEVILEVSYLYSESGVASSWIAPWYTSLEGGWNLVVPTQSMVNEYETSNGKLITDKTNTLYDENQPYLNRDPRFYATIIYPGKSWNDRWWNSLDKQWPNASTVNIEFYNSTETHHSLTGYCLAKWAAPTSMLVHDDINDNQGVNYIVFRHAEVLLNYAEALISLNKLGDAAGNLSKAASLINQVRQRSTSPCVFDGYGDGTITYSMPPISVSDAATMEAQVRHERRVELAFDGLRWYDLKRWKTLEKVMPGPVYGVRPGTIDITDIDPVSNSAKVKFSDIKHINATQDRVFNPARDYFWPIPPNDVTTEKGVLIQNPNW